MSKIEQFKHSKKVWFGALLVSSIMALWLLVTDLSVVSSQFERDASHNARKYAADTENYIADRCAGLSSLNKNDCEAKAYDARDTDQREELDLAAQKVTAWWTKIMGIAALVGMTVSVIGVILVYVTFRETKRTANVAWSIGIAQVRARIALQDYTIATPGSLMRLGDNGSVFFLKIRNIGLTPAEQIDVSGTLEAVLPTGEVVQSALSLNPESKREIEGQTTERLPLICGQNFRDSFVPIIGGDQIAFKAILKVSASDLFNGRESLHFEVKGSFGGGAGTDCQWYGEVVPESVRREETRKPQEPE